uniref:Hedgehog N-terminal signalling domain-containing protein n=1 Tax=Glossina pallidipes TaxID=7398 RepID=A0A1B0AHI3_GLOPL
MEQNQRVPCLNIETAEHFCSDCDIRSNVNSEIRDTYARSNFYYSLILCCLKRKTIAPYLRYTFHMLLIICLITSAFGCGPGRSFGFSHRRNLNYRPKPLVQKEHVPNIPEQTLGASGVSEGAIKRDSPNFKKLIWVESDYIVFKDEEGTGADRFMSRNRHHTARHKSNLLGEKLAGRVIAPNGGRTFPSKSCDLTLPGF